MTSGWTKQQGNEVVIPIFAFEISILLLLYLLPIYLLKIPSTPMEQPLGHHQ